MRQVVFLLTFCFLLFSCEGNKKNGMSKVVAEWLGKEMAFPDSLVFTQYGEDTVEYSFSHSSYTIVNYVDSMGCMSCKLQLLRWRSFIAKIDSVSSEKVSFVLSFCPKNVEELTYLLKRDYFDYPVCIDQTDMLNKLNHFPDKMEFRTFLLDKNNRIVALGNPILNPKIEELYVDIIRGKKVDAGEKRVKTDVEIEEANQTLGVFDWQQKQTTEFVLKNIGDQLLGIDGVVTSCGCITTEYPKEPVPPNGTVSLSVTYKAEKPGYFNKAIKVYCNVETAPVLLRLTGRAQ